MVPVVTEYFLRTGHAGSVADALTGSAHIKRKKEEDLMTEKDKEIRIINLFIYYFFPHFSTVDISETNYSH